MRTTEDQAVAAGHSVAVDPARWQELFGEVLGRVAVRFAAVELRWRARAFVAGLLADLPRRNCWTIAEHAGDSAPDGMRHLLARPNDDLGHRLRWSVWRRRHQARARTCHYQRQATRQPWR